MGLCDDLRRQIMNDQVKKTKNARSKISKNFDNEVINYYGSPKQYVNTGNLIDAMNVTDVSVNGNECSFTVEMDGDRISYSTGTPLTGEQVVAGTEEGLGEYGHGQTVGHHGYFKRTEESIPDALDSAFGN